jgi:hypothetical protein
MDEFTQQMWPVVLVLSGVIAGHVLASLRIPFALRTRDLPQPIANFDPPTTAEINCAPLGHLRQS